MLNYKFIINVGLIIAIINLFIILDFKYAALISLGIILIVIGILMRINKN